MSDPVEEVIAEWRRQGRSLAVAGADSMVWEAGAGEPVVCLHGVPASAFLYRKLITELAERGLRGMAFDLPGLGFADRPERFDYSWSGLGAWSAAAIDALELERLHLVVHDIGGPIGFDVVARIPERIASLTVLNTMTRVASFRRPWAMEPFARRGIGELYLRTMQPFAFERLMRLQGVGSDVPAAELRAYVSLLKREDDGRAFLRIMRGFERTRAFEERIVSALRDRTFPAQLAWGESDPALRIDHHGEQTREVLGVPDIHRLDGKHFIPEDAPTEIAALIAEIAG